MPQQAQPQLNSQRLLLRAFKQSDAKHLHLLANNERIADVTANIPYPYPAGLAEDWISTHKSNWEQTQQAIFAITRQTDQQLIGCISLMHIDKQQAELGYWIGVEYWGNGYCTEACQRIMQFGFETLALNKVYAQHLTRNPASARVLLKTGFQHIASITSQCGYRQRNEPTERYLMMPASNTND